MTDETIADRLLGLFDTVSLSHLRMPKDIQVLDPFNGEHQVEVRRIVQAFHRKFYSDNTSRRLMLGINPGRLGAGSTGLSFTDTKRCVSDLEIPITGLQTHEPSSDFFYRMIRSTGGPSTFYKQVYVHAVCPLGFTILNKAGNRININYYDDPVLQRKVTPFITQWLQQLTAVGFKTDVAYCIGTGKNYTYLNTLNQQEQFFDKIVPLEHPRYIMQYKAKSLNQYIEKYIRNVFDQ